ncbi:hypothetical protein PIB30_014074 [Stylosanthes scabra]|uniref:Uncharacterized protein n=1 Tax=Stylosanthes scabra TaxID=79078 RepID=A0ABU6R5K4_9FABA|nr:hypothetical protein [Stylosanthes scabra]
MEMEVEGTIRECLGFLLLPPPPTPDVAKSVVRGPDDRTCRSGELVRLKPSAVTYLLGQHMNLNCFN